MVPPDAQPDRPNDNPEQAEFPSSHTLAETSGSRGRGGLSRRGFIRGGAAVGVAAAAAVPTLAGCGAKGGSNLSSAGKPVKGGPKTTRNPAPHYPPDYVGPIASFKGPITTERARLKVVVSQDPVVGDWKINHFSKWYAKRTNVDIDWQVIAAGTGDQSDLITKVNAIIASGDLPDVFMTGFTPSQLALFGQDQRLFIPLDKYIDDYGVETKRLLKEFPVAKQVCTAPDGKMYSLPNVNDCFHCQGSIGRAWIYQPWLDELGLQMPSTTDELETVLEAFKTKDPNKNGRGDESGFTTDKDTLLDDYFMGSFLYNPGLPWLALQDDKVYAAFAQPEWREGLRYMHRLYSRGLIDKYAFTQTNEQLQRVANAKAVTAGTVRAFYWGSFMTIDQAAKHPRYADYVALPPMKGPAGVRVYPWDYYVNRVSAGHFVVTNACKVPEIAVMWGDGQYELEAIIRSYGGDMGKDWQWSTPGKKGLEGEQAIYNLKQFPAPNGHSWNQAGIQYRTLNFREAQEIDPKNPTFEGALQHETKQSLYPFRSKQENELPPLYMNSDQSSAVADMSTTINDFVKQSTASFVTGKSDPNKDKDWKAYLSTLDKMGLSEYLKINQQAYEQRSH